MSRYSLFVVFLALSGLTFVLPCSAQYIAVFVDGRLLPIKGVRVVNETRVKLEMGDGGSIEIPLTRLDHVIDDVIEEKPTPIPPVTCSPEFVDDALDKGTKYRVEITNAAQAANLHPKLVQAVIRAESNFNPYAVSRVGAAGLMQLMPTVWMTNGIASPYVPADNLQVGCRHLRALIDRYKDLNLALAAYNAGVAVVDKYGGIPPYRETRDYVRRVSEQFCSAQVMEKAGKSL